MATDMSVPETDDAIEIYKQLESYPWAQDKEFQGGLSAILGPSPNPAQISDLTIRAQCFYLSRKKAIPIDFNGYKAYLASRPPSASSTKPSSPSKMAIPLQQQNPSPTPEAAPHPKAFLEIVQLIQSGEPIPGIKDIPDTVLLGQGSIPSLSRRKKPWEKDLPDTEEVGGTFGDRRDDYIPQELPDDQPKAEAKST